MEGPGVWPVTLVSQSPVLLFRDSWPVPWLYFLKPEWFRFVSVLYTSVYAAVYKRLRERLCVSGCAQQPISEHVWGWEFSKFPERGCGRQWGGKGGRRCHHSLVASCGDPLRIAFNCRCLCRRELLYRWKPFFLNYIAYVINTSLAQTMIV